MQFNLKLLMLISHPGITQHRHPANPSNGGTETFSRLQCAYPSPQLPCFLVLEIF